MDHEGQEIKSIVELVDRYYYNPEDYFQFNLNDKTATDNDHDIMFKAAAAVATNNNVFYQQQILQNHLKNNFQKSDVSDVYFQNGKITSEYQQKPDNNIENTTESLQESNKLHIFKNPAYSLTFFKCYYCDDFHTNVEYDYEKHVITDHHDKPCYPSKADLEKLGLKAQGKSWETK